MNPLLEFRNVTFAYEGAAVLRSVSLSVAEGEFLAVIGPNGGGKSTLLKLAIGLIAPSRGEVRLYGRPPGESLARIGYVPQETNINPHFPVTVRETVRMGLLNAGPLDRVDETAAIDGALEALGIRDLAGERIGSLSGGQRQRALVARAIIGRPDLLILDEPVASVDAEGQQRVYGLLADVARRLTVIMVSHDVNLLLHHASSVACVNGDLCRHNAPRITPEMLKMAFHCTVDLLETVADHHDPGCAHGEGGGHGPDCGHFHGRPGRGDSSRSALPDAPMLDSGINGDD